ncbi:hypothetical protein D3C86_2042340 [compost metagenome]
MVGQFPAFQQLDQMWARDIEQVGGLLSGQLRMYRHDLDRIACCQLRQDVDQQPQCRGGKLDVVGFILLIDYLNLLSFKVSRKIRHQCTLAFNGCFDFTLHG